MKQMRLKARKDFCLFKRQKEKLTNETSSMMSRNLLSEDNSMIDEAKSEEDKTVLDDAGEPLEHLESNTDANEESDDDEIENTNQMLSHKSTSISNDIGYLHLASKYHKSKEDKTVLDDAGEPLEHLESNTDVLPTRISKRKLGERKLYGLGVMWTNVTSGHMQCVSKCREINRSWVEDIKQNIRLASEEHLTDLLLLMDTEQVSSSDVFQKENMLDDNMFLLGRNHIAASEAILAEEQVKYSESTDDYEKALKKRQRAIESSNVDTNDEEEARRAVKQPQRLGHDFSDSEGKVNVTYSIDK
ncbi:unnamed protein product [Mytilus edulis]|uniref:Uncharacterized protein n=1 Tax=Mytilus edulis TaxID=6550 RepID=A0A8S3UVK5_MYTED|nr:unnamed protein product [Mytilus edulis]